MKLRDGESILNYLNVITSVLVRGKSEGNLSLRKRSKTLFFEDGRKKPRIKECWEWSSKYWKRQGNTFPLRVTRENAALYTLGS